MASSPSKILTLYSSSTRVQPRMFHTIVLQTPSSVNSLQLKSPEFLHLHGKRLCLTFGSINTGNTTVDKPSMARVVSQLPLHRTELPCEQLVQIERESLCTGSLPVWCTTLTHLKVLYWHLASMDDHIYVPLLQHLGALTHLAIDWCMFVPELHERVDIASFLETKPLLQIVLVDAVTGW
ncbi:hypothetical protein BKA70DRAFT_1346337, partial [Coprinopsis sp. MPI-PUGE-AT-0042]